MTTDAQTRPAAPRRLHQRFGLWLPLVLLACTVAYLAVWPHDFYWEADEGQFLYEAKRVLDGDVIYRDFFEIITPASLYVMAAAFGLFGLSIATARMTMAAVHTAIVLVIYLSGRALGVRPALAACAGLAHVALSYPYMSVATPHWMSSLLALALLWTFLRRGRSAPRTALLPGVLSGTLIAVQQQRGVAFAVAGFVMLVFDHIIARRYRSDGPPLRAAIQTYVIGLVASLAAWLLPIVIFAGVDPLITALVSFPLYNYYAGGVMHQGGWGWFPWFIPGFSPILTYMPIVLVSPIVRTVLDWIRRANALECRQLVVLIVFGAASVASVWYNPDYIHLAFIAGVFFVIWAESLEWLLRMAQGFTTAGGASGWILSLVLTVWFASHLDAQLKHRRKIFPLEHETGFGRINFAHKQAVILYDTIRDAANGGAREVFCYHACAGLYLMTGTDNPTRFQQLIPRYNSPEQFDEAFASLSRRRTPLVIVAFSFWSKWAEDPINPYLAREYRRMPVAFKAGPFPAYMVFTRRSDGDKAPSTPP